MKDEIHKNNKTPEVNKTEKDSNVHSPCKGECNLDGNGLYCTGCYRTVNEIRYWREHTEEYKKVVLENCKIRETKDISHIPSGVYCYTPKKFNPENGSLEITRCPYWGFHPDFPEQENGLCLFTGQYDWNEEGFGGLLWDQCKECNINNNLDDYELS